MSHTHHQMIRLLFSLALLGLTTDAHSKSQTSQGGPLNNSPITSKPERPITLPTPETEYAMRIIKPSPNYECKIRHVAPDPTLNYTIRYAYPKIRRPFMGQNYWHGGKGRRGYPGK